MVTFYVGYTWHQGNALGTIYAVGRTPTMHKEDDMTINFNIPNSNVDIGKSLFVVLPTLVSKNKVVNVQSFYDEFAAFETWCNIVGNTFVESKLCEWSIIKITCGEKEDSAYWFDGQHLNVIKTMLIDPFRTLSSILCYDLLLLLWDKVKRNIAKYQSLPIYLDRWLMGFATCLFVQAFNVASKTNSNSSTIL